MRLIGGAAASVAAALIVACSVSPTCGVFAQTNLKATLEARYAAMKAAMTTHDGSALSKLLAPDFASVDVSGNAQSADQMIAEVGALKPDPNKTSTTTLTTVSQVGDTATVEQRYEMHTIKAGPDGVSHKIDLVALSTDTWIHPKGVWLLSKTMTDELTYSVDGKIVARKSRQ
jgi:hypothetical protein